MSRGIKNESRVKIKAFESCQIFCKLDLRFLKFFPPSPSGVVIFWHEKQKNQHNHTLPPRSCVRKGTN